MHGSRRTTGSVLEAFTAALALFLGLGVATSETAPTAINILGWVMAAAGAVGLMVIWPRR